MTMAVADKTGGAVVLMASPEFRLLKKRIIETTGLQYYADKDQALAERMEQRRNGLGCSQAEYFRRALDPDDAEELAALIDEITVGETYFFRYPEQFEALRGVVLPDCIARRQRDRRLRVWSAGCASGAEPYSLAILLRRDFADHMPGWQVSILGTDINRKALAQARAGLFTNWELRTASEDLKRQCFIATNKNWQIGPDYRRGVQFEYQNLVPDIDAFADRHAGTFDIIFCRNVMIYFGPALMRHLLRRFSDCLAQGGWLFVGHAEPYFEIANFFSPIAMAGTTVYRKLDAAPILSGREPWPAAREWTEGVSSAELATLPLPPDSIPLAGFDGVPFETAGGPMAIEVAPVHAPTPLQTAASDTQPTASTGSDLETIRRHADAGEWTAAVEACERALRRYPLDPALYYARALISEHIGEPAAAEEALGRAIYLDRNFALAHYHLGRCQVARGERKAAARSFANALKILGGRDDKEALAMGDGLTVAELRELVRIHVELLEAR
jgi:chemotaxis protein methyltransferase CheR